MLAQPPETKHRGEQVLGKRGRMSLIRDRWGLSSKMGGGGNRHEGRGFRHREHNHASLPCVAAQEPPESIPRGFEEPRCSGTAASLPWSPDAASRAQETSCSLD